jgi:hypothetical protein
MLFSKKIYNTHVSLELTLNNNNNDKADIQYYDEDKTCEEVKLGEEKNFNYLLLVMCNIKTTRVTDLSNVQV